MTKPKITIAQNIDSGCDWDSCQREAFAAIMLKSARETYPQYHWDLGWLERGPSGISVDDTSLSLISWKVYDSLKEYVAELAESVWTNGEFWGES